MANFIKFYQIYSTNFQNDNDCFPKYYDNNMDSYDLIALPV